MVFSDLLSEIRSLPGDDETKTRIIDLLTNEYAGEQFYIASSVLLHQRRDALAAQLKKVGYTHRDMARVFRRRLGVSRSTAWRWALRYKT